MRQQLHVLLSIQGWMVISENNNKSLIGLLPVSNRKYTFIKSSSATEEMWLLAHYLLSIQIWR